eukprot:6211198-Pleurochrysis_carterae.AAC.5
MRHPALRLGGRGNVAPIRAVSLLCANFTGMCAGWRGSGGAVLSESGRKRTRVAAAIALAVPTKIDGDTADGAVPVAWAAFWQRTKGNKHPTGDTAADTAADTTATATTATTAGAAFATTAAAATLFTVYTSSAATPRTSTTLGRARATASVHIITTGSPAPSASSRTTAPTSPSTTLLAVRHALFAAATTATYPTQLRTKAAAVAALNTNLRRRKLHFVRAPRVGTLRKKPRKDLRNVPAVIDA